MSTWTQQIDPSVQPADWKGDTPPGEKWTIYELDWALIQDMTVDQIDAMTMANSDPSPWTEVSTTPATWETL